MCRHRSGRLSGPAKRAGFRDLRARDPLQRMPSLRERPPFRPREAGRLQGSSRSGSASADAKPAGKTAFPAPRSGPASGIFALGIRFSGCQAYGKDRLSGPAKRAGFRDLRARDPLLRIPSLRGKDSADGWSRTTTAWGVGVTARGARRCSASARERWKAGSAPRNRRQRRHRSVSSPEPAVTHRRSCQRVSAPPPPHRLALEAYRSQLHVRALALHSPCSVTSSGRPSAARSSSQWRGWDSNPRSRAHEAREDSRSSTARRAHALPHARIWPAGVEPAVSGSRNRRDGQASPQPGGVDDRGIEPRTAALSERRRPSRPVVGGRCGGEATAFRDPPSRRLGPRAGICFRGSPRASKAARRQGVAPCSTGSQPEGSLLALRRSLAGRSRTSVGRGRSAVLVH